jgi:hypothetical protein
MRSNSKKELETKNEQAMAKMAEKLNTSNNRVKPLTTKLKSAEAEAAEIDNIIFRKKCFEFAFQHASITLRSLIHKMIRLLLHISIAWI